jgi:hypothetical protein
MHVAAKKAQEMQGKRYPAFFMNGNTFAPVFSPSRLSPHFCLIFFRSPRCAVQLYARQDLCISHRTPKGRRNAKSRSFQAAFARCEVLWDEELVDEKGYLSRFASRKGLPSRGLS